MTLIDAKSFSLDSKLYIRGFILVEEYRQGQDRSISSSLKKKSTLMAVPQRSKAVLAEMYEHETLEMQGQVERKR